MCRFLLCIVERVCSIEVSIYMQCINIHFLFMYFTCTYEKGIYRILVKCGNLLTVLGISYQLLMSNKS